MYDVLITEQETELLSGQQIEKAVKATLKKTQTFLTRESVKALGVRMKIRKAPLNKRIRKSSVKGNRASVWFGVLPIPVDSLRSFYQNKRGVVSGREVYPGAFAQRVKNSPMLVWERWVERQKASPRKKRNPNGQRVLESKRRFKSKIQRVLEPIDIEAQDIIDELENDTLEFFKRTLTDELFKQRQ
ncbi:hypothetical protein P7F88_25005 [Vibrio hannami]|uniref:hypothetical protein n=1 Tax=Vibrio hannami TaxID=2717094 RepID=UPI00240F2917|nr:hypothetical protein [Vibrio hannami]MDG3089123.1 hypothetical protein [Vibrio hannami]